MYVEDNACILNRIKVTHQCRKVDKACTHTAVPDVLRTYFFVR